MFERLLNLDVELRCLSTKAFVKKEEIVDKVFYPEPKKKKTSEVESKTEESQNQESQKSEEEKSVTESLKETLSEYGDILEEVAKVSQSDEALKVINSELRDALEGIKESLQRGEVPKLTDVIQVQEEPEPVQVIDVQTPVEVPVIKDEPTLGPDFSKLQNGVNYNNGPSMLSQNPNLKPVTVEDVEKALEKEKNKNKK